MARDFGPTICNLDSPQQKMTNHLGPGLLAPAWAKTLVFIELFP